LEKRKDHYVHCKIVVTYDSLKIHLKMKFAQICGVPMWLVNQMDFMPCDKMKTLSTIGMAHEGP
jgi:hypothetical protein